MKRTYKQIIEEFNTFATNHKGIKQFEAKPTTNFVAKNYVYPLMWVDIKSVSFGTGEARLKLDIDFVDIIKVDYENFVQGISDTMKLANDFYSYFTEYEEDYGFYFSDNAPVSQLEYAFDDKLVGNRISITVQTALIRNLNQVPI